MVNKGEQAASTAFTRAITAEGSEALKASKGEVLGKFALLHAGHKDVPITQESPELYPSTLYVIVHALQKGSLCRYLQLEVSGVV